MYIVYYNIFGNIHIYTCVKHVTYTFVNMALWP